MLERLLAHLRYAVILRECAAQGRKPADCRLFESLASLHEARAHKAMRQVQQALSLKLGTKHVSDRGRDGGVPNRASPVIRHTPLGRSRSAMSGERPRYR